MNNRTASDAVSPQRLAVDAVVHPPKFLTSDTTPTHRCHSVTFFWLYNQQCKNLGGLLFRNRIYPRRRGDPAKSGIRLASGLRAARYSADETIKIIVIVGPTASGKSELAVRLAKKLALSKVEGFNGAEIISADSRQVYRGLDIGSGKVLGKWAASRRARSIISNTVRAKSRTSSRIFAYKGIPHHCIDFVPPQRTFTVAEYKKCAESAIYDIASRKKLPILVGGTGFWIDALVHGLALPPVPPNHKLRRHLAQKSAAELLAMLRCLDPRRAETIEPKNPRRLIRAIEIAKALGRVPKIKKKSPYHTLWIGINPSYETRSRKIHKRLLKRIRAGMIQEARKLRRSGLPWKRFYELGLEYRFLAEYLRGKLTRPEMVQQLERAINHYARRQETWFKRNREIHWIKSPKEAKGLMRKFLTD